MTDWLQDETGDDLGKNDSSFCSAWSYILSCGRLRSGEKMALCEVAQLCSEFVQTMQCYEYDSHPVIGE